MCHSVSEVIVSESAWWISTRGQVWGPFDYQWSGDLRGIEFTYQGRKFGEVCSAEEFFADLTPFRIPISVCQVAAVITGALALSIDATEKPEARLARLKLSLEQFGFERFDVRRAAPGSAQADGF